MRFEDTPGLFGSGTGIATHGEIKCGICGKIYNRGADENEEYNNEGVIYTDFAGITIAECCYEKVENEIMNRMTIILPWYKRCLLAKQKSIEEALAQISK